MVLGFRVSYYGAEDSTTVRTTAGSSRAPMCPCSACWEGLPHGTKAMNSWRKKKQQQQQKQFDSPASSTSSLASTLSEKSTPSSSPKPSKKKTTLASRLTRRPSTESFASDMVPLRGTTSFQSTAETLRSSDDGNSFLDEKI